MRINPIQQNQNCNFKGTVTPSVKKYINESIRRECSEYIEILANKTIAEKKVLEQIKGKWEYILSRLETIAKSLHKDTKIKVYETENTDFLSDDTEVTTYLCIKNNKLPECSEEWRVSYISRYITPQSMSSDDLIKVVDSIKPEEIEKGLLEQYKNMAIESRFKDLSDAKKANSVVQKYREELGLGEDKEFANIIKNKIKSDSKKTRSLQEEKLIEKSNSELLKKFLDDIEIK